MRRDSAIFYYKIAESTTPTGGVFQIEIKDFNLKIVLDGIQQHGKILQQCACHNENVEYGMHPFMFTAQTIEHRADGVGDTANEQQQKSGFCHGFASSLPYLGCPVHSYVI